MSDTDLDALRRTPEPEHASIPAASWADLWEYHTAMSGEGVHGYTWEDKPHRLVYDLTAMCAKHRAEIAALRARAEVAEALSAETMEAMRSAHARAEAAEKALAECLDLVSRALRRMSRGENSMSILTQLAQEADALKTKEPT